MEKLQGFCDFCLPSNDNNVEFKKSLEESVRLGYRTVAIDYVFDCRRNSKNEKFNGPDIIPVPKELNVEDFKGKLQIITRLTIIFSDPGVLHSLNNSLNLKKYRLVVARPVNENALTICCSSFPCDMILLTTEENDIRLSRKNYSIAYRRGLFFEIQYAPMIIDSTHRKRVIMRSQRYQTVGKLKNIVITSGAKNWIELRSPYDVANLGLLFGLSEEQAKHSIKGQCQKLVLKAEGRRHGKTIIYIKEADEIQNDSSDDEASDNNADVEDATNNMDCYELSEDEKCHPKKKIKLV